MTNFLSKLKIKNIAIALVIAIFFIVDRYLKLLAFESLSQQPIKIIGNFFSFNFTANYFMAFSLPFSGIILNIIISSIVLFLNIYIFYLILNKKNKGWEITLLTFILVGAISNLIDRLTLGYVIDYLELKYFTVFNLADVMISFGAILLILKNLKK